MLIAALFIITKTQKQGRRPWVGEWENKLWNTQAIDYYSTLKRNELSSREKTWRDPKCIFQSKRSQSENITYCIDFNYMTAGKDKTKETVNRSVVARGWDGGVG